MAGPAAGSRALLPRAVRRGWLAPAAVLAVLLFAGTSALPSPGPESRLKAFDLAGEPRSLRDLRGAPAVIEVWASWCSYCKPGLKELDVLARKLPAGSVRLVALSIDQDADAMRAFLESDHPDAAFEVWTDPSGSAAALLGVKALPGLVVLDDKGRIVDRVSGDSDGVHEALAQVEAAIARMKRPRGGTQRPDHSPAGAESPLVPVAWSGS